MARLYIGNLDHSIDEQNVQQWLEDHGFAVESVQIIRNLDTGESRGFAFAELPQANAEEAVRDLDGKALGENEVRVSEARPIVLKKNDGEHRIPKKRAS